MSNNCRPPRIFYTTRTHKQVKQVIRELNKTVYKNVECVRYSQPLITHIASFERWDWRSPNALSIYFKYSCCMVYVTVCAFWGVAIISAFIRWWVRVATNLPNVSISFVARTLRYVLSSRIHNTFDSHGSWGDIVASLCVRYRRSFRPQPQKCRN